jgi:hypothetical protein
MRRQIRTHGGCAATKNPIRSGRHVDRVRQPTLDATSNGLININMSKRFPGIKTPEIGESQSGDNYNVATRTSTIVSNTVATIFLLSDNFSSCSAATISAMASPLRPAVEFLSSSSSPSSPSPSPSPTPGIAPTNDARG